MLIRVIPEFKLPKPVSRGISNIFQDLGVKIKTRHGSAKRSL
jgi:hypothetical protein